MGAPKNLITRSRDCGEDLFDSAHLPIGQPDFDAVGMAGRSGQNVLDKAPGQFSAALVLFQNDTHFVSGHDVAPIFPVHSANLLSEKIGRCTDRIRLPVNSSSGRREACGASGHRALPFANAPPWA